MFLKELRQGDTLKIENKINELINYLRFTMNFKKLFLAAALIFSLFTGKDLYSQASLSDAAFSASSGTYKELTSYDNAYFSVYFTTCMFVYLPFDFYYDGQLCRYITMSPSGGLKLSTSSSSPYYNNSFYHQQEISNNYLYNSNTNIYYGGFIFGFFCDYWPISYDESNNIKYYISGTSPNRVAIFEYNGLGWDYMDDDYPDLNISFQIQLFEGSNEIVIQYGKMNRGGVEVCMDCGYYSSTSGMIGFTAFYPGYPASTYNYVNIDPIGNGNMGYGGWEAGRNPLFGTPLSAGYNEYETVMSNDAFDAITTGTTLRMSFGPRITLDRPTAEANLRRGYVYGNGTTDPSGYGNEQHPQMTIEQIPGDASVRKTISGPVTYPVSSNFKVIYDATNTFTEAVNQKFSTATPGAPSNPAFGSAPAGSLNLLTNMSTISAGIYNVANTITNNGKDYTNNYYFNIANNWDMEITKILYPKSASSTVYPNNVIVNVNLKLTNKGMNDVSAFYTIVRIHNEDDEEVYKDSVYWQAGTDDEKLALGDFVELPFNKWNPKGVSGKYTLTAYCYLVGDQELANNYWPWLISSDVYTISVAPETEAEAYRIIVPNNVGEGIGNDYYVGRPIIPQVRYMNNGISDVSDAPTSVSIVHVGTSLEVYKKQNVILTSIPAGITMNTADLTYDVFTPPLEGKYTITATVSAQDDDNEENNSYTDTFYVKPCLTGTYTIGPDKNTGNYKTDSAYNARNFTSIQYAIDTLYLVGVSGPVVFEFTTGTFNVGDPLFSAIGPALDLRGFINGISPTNTVTFKPSSTLSVSKAAVTVNLYSRSGIGIILGQSEEPTNPNAPVYIPGKSDRDDFSNPTGYIIFDGGVQKALKFVLNTPATTRLAAPFYLSQGASNYTIKNCIITSAVPANRYDDWKLPLTRFDNGYIFELDVRNSNTNSYSAGVVLRSVTPTEGLNLFDPTKQGTSRDNDIGLDTLVNHNNLITRNEISGFAYGIVSLGIGALKNNQTLKAAKYFNYENTFSNNFIYDVSRAGVFVGFEHNAHITNNKIWGVGRVGAYQAGTDVAGVMAGGEKSSNFNGYNNTNLVIDGNEISNIGLGAVTADYHSYGIKVEQCQNSYATASLIIPNKDENTLIMNNAIWGILSGNTAVNRHGIRLYTQRTALSNWSDPLVDDYNTYGDKIVNNTVLMPNDGFATTGMVTAVTIENARGTVLTNNALAVADNNLAGATNYNAVVLYVGLEPGTNGGLLSDNNIYWSKGTGTVLDSAAIFRYVQIDNNSKIVTWGTRNEFLTMNQWQMYTGADLRSVNRDFVSQLTTPDVTISSSKLRVNNVPSWPTNSVMNNRGDKLSYVLYDIDGNQRGMSGQCYDIGAFEFNGTILNSDVEVLTTSEPGAYQSSPDLGNLFSDAEYIMTTSPVDIKTKIRNNGKLDQTGLEVKVQIYRQKPRASYLDPAEFYTDAELTETVVTQIAPTATGTVSFNLADGIGKDFAPKPYADWRIFYENRTDFVDSLYTIEDWFSTMENNVTPLYKIVVSVRADEDVYNNVFTKTCRFYIKRSELNMLLSVENSPYDLTTDDIRAGSRNYDSLITGLKRIGWVNAWTSIETDTFLVQYYDVFERTGWEPRAVDYTMYKTVLWSDADDKDLTMYEIADLEKFLDAGTADNKKNLAVSSQEMVRQNWDNDPGFVADYLNATLDGVNYYTDPLNFPGTSNYYTAGTGFPYNVTDNTKWIEGVTIGKTLKQYIMATGLNDPSPVPGLMQVNAASQGLSSQAYKYNTDQVIVKVAGKKDPTMGTATTSVERSIVTLGVDWRHYENPEMIIRAIFDFFAKYDANFIPVDLAGFTAKAVSDRVEVRWETASEINTDRFEVERAQLTDAGKTGFTKIGSVTAAGKSTSPKAYGPVVDKNVSMGSTYYYRLKMVDLDGKYNYSDEAVVVMSAADGFYLGQPVPNPVSFTTDVTFSLNVDAMVTIELYDITGKLIRVLYRENTPAGSKTVGFDLSDVQNGTYTYVLKAGNIMLSNQLQVVR